MAIGLQKVIDAFLHQHGFVRPPLD